MTQHTPGPWTAGWGCGLTGPTTPVLRPFCGHEWKFTPVSKGMKTIAVCPAQESHDGDHAANARLIAAAPKLLEALKEARTFVSSDYTGSGSKDLSGGALARIDAAIAAATGTPT